MCVLNFVDVLIYGEGFVQMSLYIYVFMCESVYMCVQVRRFVCKWKRVCLGRVKVVHVCLNQMRTHGKACVN